MKFSSSSSFPFSALVSYGSYQYGIKAKTQKSGNWEEPKKEEPLNFNCSGPLLFRVQPNLPPINSPSVDLIHGPITKKFFWMSSLIGTQERRKQRQIFY